MFQATSEKEIIDAEPLPSGLQRIWGAQGNRAEKWTYAVFDDAHRCMRGFSSDAGPKTFPELREEYAITFRPSRRRWKKLNAENIQERTSIDMEWFTGIINASTEILKWQLILLEEVRSAYSDGFLPTISAISGRIMGKHIGSHDEPCAVSGDIVHCLVQHLAQGMPSYLYLDVAGPSFVCYLHEEPNGFRGFVDPNSVDDPYDDVFWSQFGQAVAALPLPHRYPLKREFAMLLQARWPELEQYQLAEVCRMLMLAIPRKILALRRGRIVPYHLALDFDVFAELSLPTSTLAGTSKSLSNALQAITSWSEMEDAMRKLFALLSSKLKHYVYRGLPLRRIRNIIRDQLSKVICLDSLEHSSLINVFSDSRLKKVVSVERMGNDVRICPARSHEHLKC